MLGLSIENSLVEAGSGSLPEKNIESVALKFSSLVFSANKLSLLFKKGKIPIIGYIQKDSYFIDLKAVLPLKISPDCNILDSSSRIFKPLDKVDKNFSSSLSKVIFISFSALISSL